MITSPVSRTEQGLDDSNFCLLEKERDQSIFIKRIGHC